MKLSRTLALVAAVAVAAIGGVVAAPAADAAVVNYVNNQSMANLSSVCAQTCFYASRTYNEVQRASAAYLWRLSGAQSGTAWDYALDNNTDATFHVTTSSIRWPLTAACQNRSGATRSNITCQTDY